MVDSSLNFTITTNKQETIELDLPGSNQLIGSNDQELKIALDNESLDLSTITSEILKMKRIMKQVSIISLNLITAFLLEKEMNILLKDNFKIILLKTTFRTL